MAKIIFDLGDLVADSEAQFGIIISPNKVLVMRRQGLSYSPVVKSTEGFLPIHPEAVNTLNAYHRFAFLAVIAVMTLPDKLSYKDEQINNQRDNA